jgi:Flp pilus assembly protein TadG
MKRGAVLPLLIVGFLVVTAMTAFSVDFGYISIVKAELRTAVDAATRAGASGLRVSPAEVRQRAKDIASSNKVNGKFLTLLDSDIVLGNWNASTRTFTPLTGSSEANANSLRITGQLSQSRGTSLNLMFARVLGQSFKEMSVSAVAGTGQAADVVILQDITSSFSDELSDAKTGDGALLDALYAGGTGSGRVAVLVHTGWGKTLASLQSISSNYSYLSCVITSIDHCGTTGMPVCSGTDIAAGFDEAIKTFTASGYVASPGGKVIVLVSDGQPEGNATGSHPTLSNDQLLSLAQTRADQLWAMKVNIYVVFYDRDNDATAAANLNSLIRGAGIFVRVNDPKLLPASLSNLSKNMPVQLVQ